MKRKFIEMGARIKSRRNELDMNQAQLAEAIGISNNHMSSIERGKETPSLDLFVQICETLNVRPDYLLLGSISSNNVPQTIIENLQLCSEHDLLLAEYISKCMVQLNELNRTIE